LLPPSTFGVLCDQLVESKLRGIEPRKRNQRWSLRPVNLIASKDIRWKNCTTLVLRQL
jgi:hypothetical protein